MVGKSHSTKTDQLAKPGNATVNGQCISVAINWANEMEWNRPSMTFWSVFRNPVTYTCKPTSSTQVDTDTIHKILKGPASL